MSRNKWTFYHFNLMLPQQIEISKGFAEKLAFDYFNSMLPQQIEISKGLPKIAFDYFNLILRNKLNLWLFQFQNLPLNTWKPYISKAFKYWKVIFPLIFEIYHCNLYDFLIFPHFHRIIHFSYWRYNSLLLYKQNWLNIFLFQPISLNLN